MPDDSAPTQHYDTPYLVTMPDGSTQSRILTTTGPPSVGDIADHATAQGMTFAGFPQPPTPAEQPSGATPTSQVAPPPTPSFTERAAGIMFPKRSIESQVPSIGLGAGGAWGGAALGAMVPPPFNLVTIPAGALSRFPSH